MAAARHDGGRRSAVVAIRKRLQGTYLGATRALPSSRGLVVCYHDSGDPAGDPAAELVPRVGTAVLRAQLRLLQQHFDLVRVSDLLHATSSRRSGGPLPLAVTFDDDLPAHRLVALPILSELGIPATFFLTGSGIEGPRWYWWQLLDQLGRRAVPAAEVVLRDVVPSRAVGAASDVHAVAGMIEGLSPAERDAVTLRLAALVDKPPPATVLGEADVRALVRADHEIGFHTARHDALTTVADDHLVHALTDGVEPIRRAAGRPITSVAYPHGRVDARVVAAARACGWSTGLTTTERAVAPRDDPLALGRVSAPISSVGGLAAALLRALVRTARRPAGTDAAGPPHSGR